MAGSASAFLKQCAAAVAAQQGRDVEEHYSKQRKMSGSAESASSVGQSNGDMKKSNKSAAGLTSKRKSAKRKVGRYETEHCFLTFPKLYA